MTERGLKNINVFLFNVYQLFYFCHVFLRFLTFFYFFLERFLYIYGLQYTAPLANAQCNEMRTEFKFYALVNNAYRISALHSVEPEHSGTRALTVLSHL